MQIEHYEQTRVAFTKEINNSIIVTLRGGSEVSETKDHFYFTKFVVPGEGSEPDSAMHLKYIHIKFSFDSSCLPHLLKENTQRESDPREPRQLP